MPSKYIYTKVDDYELKLSNLNKVLYSEGNITKAEIIEYYLRIAPIILRYIRDRPLTLIRYPDGIDSTKFYSKSLPDWAPDWIQHVNIKHSEETIKYLKASNNASIVWIANLAGLEMHPMQMTTDMMDYPDHFIFDLDPPEGSDFQEVKEIAFKLKSFLESYGYVPFLKTSGGKGLHIIAPILRNFTHEEMTTSVKKLAQEFVKQNRSISTLHIKKDSRKGKTLIDIYRNLMAQTTVAPYSLRARPTAPVSTPITWKQLEEIHSSTHFHIRNIHDHVATHGDLWEKWRDHASELHDMRASSHALSADVEEKLASYLSKRDFGKTPEPSPSKLVTSKNRFSIQLHDASNLHYDLRLEEAGVLLSWAIPKGLPPTKGIKRLAIRTEDHPLEYLEFEGTIPKDQYGAGKMWVFALGTVEWEKKSDDSYKFRLMSKQVTGSYKLYNTKRENQWIIERQDEQLYPIMTGGTKPMLADVSKKVPTEYGFEYEIKWDGIRSIVKLEDDKIKIFSRSGRELTDQFPELEFDKKTFDVESAIFDGEIICMDEQGRPVFANVISRMHTKGSESIRLASKTNPVYCYLFDCIFLDGRDITSDPWERRRAFLKVAFKSGDKFRISESMKDGNALLEAAKNMQLEGIMAKRVNAPYVLAKRSTHWLKIKLRDIMDCWIIGYTDGKGDRSNIFGALHLATKEGKAWKYMGKVGTGFNKGNIPTIMQLVADSIPSKKIIEDQIEEKDRTHWIKPQIQCEIQYASLTNNGTLREPVFIRLREDLLE